MRITGDPIKDELIAPNWLLKKFCVLNDIDKKMVLNDTYQGKIDGKLESTILYTESLNPDEIESMIEVKDKVYKICK